MLAGVLLGALLVGAGIMDVRAAHADPQPKAQSVTLSRQDLRLLKRLAFAGCALVLHEDGSASWRVEDDERTMCQEYVGQVGR